MRSLARQSLSVALIVAISAHTVHGGCTGGTVCGFDWENYVSVLETTSTFCDYTQYADTNSEACQAGYYLTTSNTVAQCPAECFCRLGYTCHDDCLKGNYCPVGSDLADYCSSGSYCPTPSEKYTCPKGKICPTGSFETVDCTPMSICVSSGQGSAFTLDYVFWLSLLPVSVLLTVLGCGWVCSHAGSMLRSEAPDQTEPVGPEVDETSSRHVVRDLVTEDPRFREWALVRGKAVAWKDVVVQFGKKKVLKGVSGSIQPKTLTAIMGPSGAGKTTLLNVLTAQQRITSGEAYYGDSPVTPAFLRKIAFVSQFNAHYPTLSVKEYLVMMLIIENGLYKSLFKIGLKSLIRQAYNLCRLCAIEKTFETQIGSEARTKLSGGQRKRLAVARELIKDPSVIICDEPTSGLDASAAFELMKLLKTVAVTGKTVFLTIHQPRHEIWNMISHLVILASCGRVFYRGRAMKLVPYLEGLDFLVNPDQNLADFVMDVVSGHIERGQGRSIDPNHLCDLFDEMGDTLETLPVVDVTEYVRKTAQTVEGTTKASDVNESKQNDVSQFIRSELRRAKAKKGKRRSRQNQLRRSVHLLQYEVERIIEKKRRISKDLSVVAVDVINLHAHAEWDLLRRAVRMGLVINVPAEAPRTTGPRKLSKLPGVVSTENDPASLELGEVVSQRTPRAERRSCACHCSLGTQTVILTFMTILMSLRDKKVIALEYLSFLIVGVILGIVFQNLEASDTILACSASIIPVSVLPFIVTQRNLGSEAEVGMRNYYMKYGISSVAYSLSKSMVIHALLVVYIVTFCVWSLLLYNITLLVNVGKHISVTYLQAAIVSALTATFIPLTSARQALIIMVCVICISQVLSGSSPTMSTMRGITPATAALYQVNWGRWYNHLLYIVLTEWYSDNPAWQAKEMNFWDVKMEYYAASEGLCWGLMCTYVVIFNITAFMSLYCRTYGSSISYWLTACCKSRRRSKPSVIKDDAGAGESGKDP